jgi:hypothetical protein
MGAEASGRRYRGVNLAGRNSPWEADWSDAMNGANAAD